MSSATEELSLGNLKRLLKSRVDAVAMQELCMTFGEEAKTIYMLLEHFINRGQVEKSTMTPKCGKSCNLCQPLHTCKFRWVES